MQKAHKPLLCKWYPYTGCKKTFDATEVKAWKDHVVAHFINTKNFKSAIGHEITCWVRACPKVLQVGPQPTAPESTFSQMMDHVHMAHMSPPSPVDWYVLRDDDITLICRFWRSLISPAALEGDVSWEMISYWSDIHNLPIPRRVVSAETEERRELVEVNDKFMRDERREARRHASEMTE